MSVLPNFDSNFSYVNKLAAAVTVCEKDLQAYYDYLTEVMGDTMWVAKTKKGPQDCEAGIANMTYQSKDDKHLVAIGGLHFANDNHLPRKNVGKPKHGAFDAGHVNAVANLKLTATLLGKDTLRATLDRCEPELAGDLMDRGLVLSGGSSQLVGLDKLLSAQTGLPVVVADDPLSAVAEGTGVVMNELDFLARNRRAS